MREESEALVFVFPSPNFEEIGGRRTRAERVVGAALAAEGAVFCLGMMFL